MRRMRTTPPDKRLEVFGLRYWAINVGASVGPLVGGYLVAPEKVVV